MSRFWNHHTRELTPYVPGEQPKDLVLIKLNTNENPYPPSSKVIEAIQSNTDGGLRLYPDPDSSLLKEVISKALDLDVSQVFCGNGSDEVLAMAFQTFFEQGSSILYPDITYSFYPVYAQMFKLQGLTPKLRADFSISAEDYFNAEGGVIIANPNAPTGIALPLEQIAAIAENNPDHVVIIDEAYVDFGAASAVSLINTFDNLLVIQTMSKSRSLAGMRIGYALGHPDLIEGLERVKNSINSYTMDRLAIVAGAAAMADEPYFRQCTDRVISTREWLKTQLRTLGFAVTDSKANFLFVSPPDGEAEALYAYLRKNGVLVRYFKKPIIDKWLRVSIGLENEMKTFFELVERYVEEE